MWMSIDPSWYKHKQWQQIWFFRDKLLKQITRPLTTCEEKRLDLINMSIHETSNLICQIFIVLLATWLCIAPTTAKPAGKRRSQDLDNQIESDTGSLVYQLMEKMQGLADEVKELKERQERLMTREFGPTAISDRHVTKIGKNECYKTQMQICKLWSRNSSHHPYTLALSQN